MTDLIPTPVLQHQGAAREFTTAAMPAVRFAEPLTGSWRVSSGACVSGPESLTGLLNRFARDVATDSGITLVVASHEDDAVTADIVAELDATGLEHLALATGVRADGQTVEDADERYSIDIEPTGVRIRGATPEAVHRALTTLRQLITAGTSGSAADVAGVRLADGPRFAWRGLSVDVVRTFHDPESIRRIIDMCSLYKLNVLHLHLTDDQGWRFEVPTWPLLAEVGGAGALGDRPGGYYTQQNVAELVQYASKRFVTIVPEVDLPGHVHAVFRAYPDLAPARDPRAEAAAAAGLAIGTLDLDRGPTRQFVAEVLSAVAQQFHTSAYIHVGGDEAFGMSDAAHAAFVDEAMAVVRGLGKRAIGWQEAARANVGADDVVQYWIEPNQMAAMMDSGALDGMLPPELASVFLETMGKSTDDVPTALAKGARVLVSPNTVLYFDQPHAEPAVGEEQEAIRARIGLPFYPGTTLREMVEWDPVLVTPGIDSDDRIAGVEGAVWCETVNNRDDLEFLLLPRLAGLGERAWSAAPTDWDEYVLRLAAGSRAWDRRGWAWFRPASIDWQGLV
ncbi:MAG: family 20 glycosylhydrolase [Microbacterium sp.]